MELSQEKREVTHLSSSLQIRRRILDFEDRLREIPGAVEGDSELCPLKHEFPPGLYVRTITIPAGTVLTGRLHRHAHPNFLHRGIVEMATEHGGIERIEGPKFMISKGLTKRALVAVTEVEWTTIHANPNNLRDPAEIAGDVIIDDLTDYKKEAQPCLG